MKVFVTMNVEGRFTAEIDVDVAPGGKPDVEELKRKATEAYSEADFGELEDIEMGFVKYESEGCAHVDLI